jgi:hypothetical protein
MDEINEWLQNTRTRAIAISNAFQRSRTAYRRANLLFVALPSVCSTAAAIFAAFPDQQKFALFSLPLSSILAGSAAILIAVHKALKCDEYQAECLRLSQAYQSVAISADSALSGPESERSSHQKILTSELENLSKNAGVQVSTNFMT